MKRNLMAVGIKTIECNIANKCKFRVLNQQHLFFRFINKTSKSILLSEDKESDANTSCPCPCPCP